MQDDPKEIADGLTPLDRQMLLEGCACGTADRMVELGLWAPDPKLGKPYFVTTPLGLLVRAELESPNA